VGLRIGLDDLEKRQILPLLELELRTLAVNPWSVPILTALPHSIGQQNNFYQHSPQNCNFPVKINQLLRHREMLLTGRYSLLS
jgi:hypothetical protein